MDYLAMTIRYCELNLKLEHLRLHLAVAAHKKNGYGYENTEHYN